MIKATKISEDFYVVRDDSTGASFDVYSSTDLVAHPAEAERVYREVTAPPKPGLDDLKLEKLAEINARCDAELMPVMSRYPAAERLSWDQQESEARAYLANPNSAVPLLSGIALARGRDVTDLAQAVLVKAEQFTALASAAIGKRQRLEDQIAAAKTAEEVAAISW
jgi:hypothetical protein